MWPILPNLPQNFPQNLPEVEGGVWQRKMIGKEVDNGRKMEEDVTEKSTAHGMLLVQLSAARTAVRSQAE
jgi:hypothetical protein